MKIDWFTVAAQALNFVVLVWLMKRFLYKPILDMIDAREKLVAGELADAKSKEADAESQRSAFEQKNVEFDTQRAALLAKATDEAKTEKARLMAEAATAADKMAATREDSLIADAKSMIRSVRRHTQDEVFEISRKALSDLATANLEERLADVFTRRLRGLDQATIEAIGAALKANPDQAVVRSAFELPAPQQSAIQAVLNETFSTTVPLRYETAPDLIGGIELVAGGQKIGWSIDEYLNSLERDVAKLVDRQTKPEAPAAVHDNHQVAVKSR
jgi:F-type H+-transporting ATPase subunit b